MISRIILSNRPENQKLLLEFIQKWARDRKLPAARRSGLERAAGEVFQYLVRRAYGPGQPGYIAVVLEEKGPRLRLIFEDDAAPHNPAAASAAPAGADAAADPALKKIQQLAESLIYYRTGDRKNRLVVFLS